MADEVFLSLSREIEAQGVGRKVAADMFGLALRAYQKKVQRLAGSSTVNERTLWEAILDAVSERGSTSRQELRPVTHPAHPTSAARGRHREAK